MKFAITFILAVTLASQTFAFNLEHAGDYVGGGTWKAEDGTTDKWMAEVSLSQVKEGVLVKEKLTIVSPNGEKYTKETELVDVPTKNGFFNVFTNGVKTGSGYCFEHYCHVGGTGHQGSQFEETFAMKDGQIYRMGSDRGANYAVSWTGKMKKK